MVSHNTTLHTERRTYSVTVGDAEANAWRSTTVKMLRELRGADLDIQTSRITTDYVASIDQGFRDFFTLDENADRVQDLRHIIDTTIAFSRLCSEQRARFEFILPDDWRTIFNEKYMDDVLGSDTESIVNKPIGLGVFPMMIKFGDEKGQNVSSVWKPVRAFQP